MVNPGLFTNFLGNYSGDDEGEARDLDQETEACWLVSLTIPLSITLWQFTNSILV